MTTMIQNHLVKSTNDSLRITTKLIILHNNSWSTQGGVNRSCCKPRELKNHGLLAQCSLMVLAKNIQKTSARPAKATLKKCLLLQCSDWYVWVGIESVPWRTKIRPPMVLITDHWSPIIPKRNPTNSMQTDLAKAAPAKVHVATTFNGISEWMMLPSSPSAPPKASPVPRGENTDHRDMRECNVPAFALQGRIWYVNYLGLQVAK